MWVQRQGAGESGKLRRAYCEICKSEIFFRKAKTRYCDCKLQNLCETSACNVVCLVAEVVLIGILALVQYYVDQLTSFQLLRNTLLGLLGLLSLTFLLTAVLIIRESFVKTKRQIDHIYSLAESEQLGLREAHCLQSGGRGSGAKQKG